MEEPYFSDEVGPAERGGGRAVGGAMPLVPSLAEGDTGGAMEVVVRAGKPPGDLALALTAPTRTPTGTPATGVDTPTAGESSLKRAATAETQESSLGGSADKGDDKNDGEEGVTEEGESDRQRQSESDRPRQGEGQADTAPRGTSTGGQSLPPLHRDSIALPLEHERWAVSAPDVDLSGSWTLIVTDAFKSKYSRYLSDLGFGYVVRTVAAQIVGRMNEVTLQSDEGRALLVRGTNPRGVWERTLVASGAPDLDTRSHRTEGEHYRHDVSIVTTPDGEKVEAEAWWERDGTVHRSWLRGGKKYGEGDFESLRYMEEGGRVLVCKSLFHPRNRKRRRTEITWRFRRAGSG